MKKEERELNRLFAKHGVEVISLELGNGHRKYRLSYNKQEFVLSCSQSPSCPYFMKHVEGDLRRKIREREPKAAA